MRIFKTSVILLACILMLLLVGCNEPEILPTAQNIEIWQQAPLLNYGSLEYEKLEVQPWNSGRLTFTSLDIMTETEAGYYILNTATGIMYYADKTDLGTWVPVCAKPSCSHSPMDGRCDAFCGGKGFLYKDGRIYFATDLMHMPELYPQEGKGFGLYSRAYNGKDVRLEYVIEEALVSAGSVRDMLTYEYWLYDVVSLQTDGSYLATSYLTTEDGLKILFEGIYYDFPFFAADYAANRGDRVFLHSSIGTEAYTIENGQLVELKNITNYWDTVRYRSGNYIRIFKEGDGFYDVDLETGEEVFVTGVNLENSRSYVLLPNCMVETNISVSRPEGEKNKFLLFDGELWREVELPKELMDANESVFFGVLGVSSDSLFCQVSEQNSLILYRIPLGTEKLVMEYCGKIG